MIDLKLIEIEIYNYCNRKCDFCPNHKIPSRQDKKNPTIMQYDVFTKIIDELADNKYKGVVSFSRYNEPLAFHTTTKRYVDYVRKTLNNKIVANTNGDFLNKQSIEIFDELTIMDYPGKGSTWWKTRLEKLNCHMVNMTDEFMQLKTPGNKDVLVFLNFKQNATVEDRGGVIKSSVVKFKNNNDRRKRPCSEPQKFLGIDYNGCATICCNMNSEFHQDYTIGNINNETLIDILNSQKRKKYISVMSSNNYEDYLKPCEFCQKDPGRYTRNNPSILYTNERK